MKTAFLAQVFSALLLAMAAIAQQPPGKIQEDSIGVLEGQVTIAMTGEVIRKAVVIARRTSSGGTYAKGPDSYSGTTDGEGKFRIESVVPGRYQLWSERQGFVRQIYIDDTGQSNLVTIVAGKGLKPITFKMMPQALITGRVLDEDGEPMPRATVTVLSKRHQQGKPILMRVTSVNANDIGEYRVPDLAQGRYWVSAYWRDYAATVAAAPPDKPEEAYAATFFPSAKTESLAQVVEVTAGQELPGIDIRMRKSQVFRIRGKVLPTGDGQPAGLVLVRPIPRDQTFYLGYYGAPSVWSKKDGTFELTGVTPGSYSICAFTQASQDLLGKTNVEVSREAVENVVVPIGLATLKGNIRVVPAAEEDSVEKTPLDSVRMQFAPFQGFAFIYPNVMSKADGSFQIDNLGLEKYRVTVAGLPKGTWLKSIRSGNLDVLNQGIDAGSGAAPLEITLSQGGGQISGVVQDAKQQPVSSGIVMMLPEPIRDGRWDLHRNVNILKNGTFTFQGIAPGDYKLFAWTEIDPSISYTDLEFLKKHEGKSQKVTIKVKGSEKVTLKQIPKADLLK